MSIKELRPSSTLLLPGTPIYRGYSTKAGGPDSEGNFVAARKILSSFELLQACRDIMQQSQNHVLGATAQGFFSLSVHPVPALWYATGGGRHPGLLAVGQLSEGECISAGTVEPVFLHEVSGNVWLDPRRMLSVELRYAEVRNRAVRDDEVLLAAGAWKPAMTLKVAPDKCPTGWNPWATSGQTYDYPVEMLRLLTHGDPLLQRALKVD